MKARLRFSGMKKQKSEMGEGRREIAVCVSLFS